MDYKISWFIEKQVALLYYLESPNEDSVLSSTKDICTLIKSSSRRLVYCITNSSRFDTLETSHGFHENSNSQPPGALQEWSLIIREHSQIPNRKTQITEQYMKMRIKSFESLSEIIEYLITVDPLLDWKMADWRVFPDKILNLKGIQLQPRHIAQSLLQASFHQARIDP